MAGVQMSDSDQPLSEINVTPLVDVMLVLLVIFILLAPMFAQALRVDLPKVSAPPSQEPKVVDVELNLAGQMSLNGELLSAVALQQSLQTRAAAEPTLVVRLNADAQLPYAQVAELMGLVRSSGVQRLAFATGKPQTPP